MVAFSSPKRSATVVDVAARHAIACGAELILLRILPDAQKVGVVAQLIATERPLETAQEQVSRVVGQLKERGVNARGEVRVGEVAQGLVAAAEEIGANLLFLGTMNPQHKPRFSMASDPIAQYLIDHCPVSLCLVRADDQSASRSSPVVAVAEEADADSD